SLGATDVFAEAAVLSLYDPDRLKSARHGDDLVAWSAFEAGLLTRNEPGDADAGPDGAPPAFGRPPTALPRFADARVVLALDADPLGCGPTQIRFAHALVAARQARSAQDFLRLYAVEP